MTNSGRIGEWTPKPLNVIALLIILQLLVTLLTDGFALSFDEAMWHYIGRNWFRNGLIPYSGGVDNKSPLIFAVFGLSDLLFGVNYWFPRVLGTSAEAIGVWYIYKIASRMAGEKGGITAMSLYGLSLLWHGTGGRFVSYTETYEVTFIILAFYKFITAKNQKDMLVCGLLAGLAFGFRISAFFGILAILIACLQKKPKDALIFAAGVTGCITLLILCGFSSGISLHDLVTFGLGDNFGSGSATDHTLAWKFQNFLDKFLYSPMPLFYPALICYIFFSKKHRLFLLWFILAFVGICVIGIFDAVHLKEVLPALSLMSAFCLAAFVDRYRLRLTPFLLMVWILFFPKSTEPLRNLRIVLAGNFRVQKLCSAPYSNPDEGTRKELGQWVRDNTQPEDEVYVAGFGAQIQAYSERISPTVYFNVTQTTLAKKRFFDDMKQHKAAVVLVPLFPEYQQHVDDDMRRFVDSVVAKNYQAEGCMFDYAVYRIRK